MGLLDRSDIPTHPLNPPPQAGDFFLREHDGRYVEGDPREVRQVGLAVEELQSLEIKFEPPLKYLISHDF